MKHLLNSNKKFSQTEHYDIQIKSSVYPNQLQQYSQFQQFPMQKNYLNSQRSQKSIKSTTCIPQKLYEISSNTKTQPPAYQHSSVSSFEKLTQIYGEVSRMKRSITQIQQSIKSFKVIIDQVQEQRSHSGLRNENIFETIKHQINNLTFILNHQLNNANGTSELFLGNQLSLKRLSNSTYPCQMEESFRRCSIQLEQGKLNLLMNQSQSRKMFRNMTQQSLDLFIQIQTRYEKLAQYLQNLSTRSNQKKQNTNNFQQSSSRQDRHMSSIRNIKNQQRNQGITQSQSLYIIEEDDRNLISSNINEFLQKIKIVKIQKQSSSRKTYPKLPTLTCEDSFQIKMVKNSFRQKFIKKVKKLFNQYSDNLACLIAKANNFRTRNDKSLTNMYGSGYDRVSSNSRSENYLNTNFITYGETKEMTSYSNQGYSQSQNCYHQNVQENYNENLIQLLEPLLVSVKIFKDIEEISDDIQYVVRYFQCLLNQYKAKLKEQLQSEQQQIKNISLSVKKQNFQNSLKLCEEKILKCQYLINQLFLIEDYFEGIQKFKAFQFFKNIFYRHENGVFSQKEKHKIQSFFKNKKIYLTYLIDYLNVQKIINFKYRKLMGKIDEYQERQQSTSVSSSGSSKFSEELVMIKQTILQKLLYPYQLIEKVQKDQKKYRQYILNGIIYNFSLHSYLDKIHENEDYELFDNKEGPYLNQKVKEMISSQNQNFLTTIKSIKCFHSSINQKNIDENIEKIPQSVYSSYLSVNTKVNPKSSTLQPNSSTKQSLKSSQILYSNSQNTINTGKQNIIKHIQACKNFSILLKYVPIHYFEQELLILNKNNFVRFIEQELSQIHDKNQLYSQLIKQNSLYQFSEYQIYQLNDIFTEVKMLQKQCISLLEIFVQINFQQQNDIQKQNDRYQQVYHPNFRMSNSKQYRDFREKPTFNQYKPSTFEFSLKEVKKQHEKLLQENWSTRTNINKIYSTLEKQIRQQKKKITTSKVFALSTLKIMENNSIMFHNPSLRQRWNEYLTEVYNLMYENAYKKICNQENIVKKESQKIIKQMQEIKTIIKCRDPNDLQNCRKIEEIIKMYKKL